MNRTHQFEDWLEDVVDLALRIEADQGIMQSSEGRAVMAAMGRARTDLEGLVAEVQQETDRATDLRQDPSPSCSGN